MHGGDTDYETYTHWCWPSIQIFQPSQERKERAAHLRCVGQMKGGQTAMIFQAP